VPRVITAACGIIGRHISTRLDFFKGAAPALVGTASIATDADEQLVCADADG